MSYKADFHVHSYYSDGIMKPTELVRMYKDKEYDVIALTDHDGVDGVPEALIAGEALKIQVIPGVEIGCGYDFGQERLELHILGYYIDIENGELKEYLKKLKEITGIDGYATYEEDKHLGLEHPLDSTLLAFDQDGEPLEWTASSGMEGYDVFSTKQKKITRLYLYQLPDFGGYTVMKDQENAGKLALFSYELEIREEP